MLLDNSKLCVGIPRTAAVRPTVNARGVSLVRPRIISQDTYSINSRSTQQYVRYDLFSFFPTDSYCFTRSSLSPLVPALNSLPGARATAVRAQMLRSTVVLLALIDWNSIDGLLIGLVPHEMGPSHNNEIRPRAYELRV